MKKILVPTDFSANSATAIRYAVDLAKHFEGSITFFHTYQTRQTAAGFRSIESLIIEDAENDMVQLKEKVEKEMNGLSLNYKIVKGEAVSTISEHADKNNFDLIIMGTKGASGLKEVFIGSVAGGVISKTRTPVMVVPENFEYRPIKTVVLAATKISPLSPEALNPLKKILNAYKAYMKIFHMAKEGSEEPEEVIKQMEGQSLSISYKYGGDGEVNIRIRKFVEESNADLLCMIRRKRGLIDRLFGGSATLKQTFNSSVPLLILHN